MLNVVVKCASRLLEVLDFRMLEQLLFITFKSETSLKNTVYCQLQHVKWLGCMSYWFFLTEQKLLKLHVSFCDWSLAGPFLSACAASIIEQLHHF